MNLLLKVSRCFHDLHIYIYIYITYPFNTERYLEVAAIESCPEWDLNSLPLNSKTD